jgi:protein SCO1/2
MKFQILKKPSLPGLSLAVFLMIPACNSKPPEASANAQRYEIKGKVVSADRANHQVTVDHEAIPGYMEAMTMTLTLSDDWVYGELTPGALIQATLIVDQGKSWLENPVITKISDPSLVGKSEESGVEPAAGTEVPDFSLINQDGKKISLKQYRDRALLLTFIYTRCPLPDYCPLMSQNFSQISQELQKKPGLKDRVRLLSISVDPDYDKPKVLREYGAKYVGSDSPQAFKQWEFASGSPEQVKNIAQFFGLNYWPEKDQIIHGLRTAIISPDGKVVKVYRGNQWKPEDVLKELENF